MYGEHKIPISLRLIFCAHGRTETAGFRKKHRGSGVPPAFRALAFGSPSDFRQGQPGRTAGLSLFICAAPKEIRSAFV